MNNSRVFKFINIIFIITILLPMFIIVLWSFTATWTFPDLLPSSYTLRGFKYIFAKENNSLQIIVISISLSFVVTFFALFLSIPAAKALGIYNFKGKKVVELVILAPVIIPSVSIGLGLHVNFIKLHLANTFVGLVLVHLIPCLPYSVRILTDVFEIIGDKFEIQARVLGCSKLKCFFYITLPMIYPGLISSAFLVFIISFSQYFLTFLIGGGKVITLPLVMVPFIQSGDKTIASAYSVIFIVTTLLFLFLIEKITKRYYNDKNINYL